MTMTPTCEDIDAPVKPRKGREVCMENRPWGYCIQSKGAHSFPVLLTQILSGAIGGAGALAACALAIVPGVIPFATGMQLGAAVIIMALSAYFLWFASRGLDLWVEVDLNQGELREVVQHRMGNRSVLSRFGFDGIASVVLLPSQQEGEARVYLVNLANTAFLCVADGPREEAACVASQLRSDLLLGGEPGVGGSGVTPHLRRIA